MNAVEIEQTIKEFSKLKFDVDEFPFKFLAAFGNKGTINRLRSGNNILFSSFILFFNFFKFVTNIF